MLLNLINVFMVLTSGVVKSGQCMPEAVKKAVIIYEKTQQGLTAIPATPALY
jgi:hypothetical protein